MFVSSLMNAFFREHLIHPVLHMHSFIIIVVVVQMVTTMVSTGPNVRQSHGRVETVEQGQGQAGMRYDLPQERSIEVICCLICMTDLNLDVVPDVNDEVGQEEERDEIPSRLTPLTELVFCAPGQTIYQHRCLNGDLDHHHALHADLADGLGEYSQIQDVVQAGDD